MSDDGRFGMPVRSRRLSRLMRIGGLAGGLASGAIAGGLQQAARGRRPRIGELLMTPGNARRIATDLARMRRAAM